MDYREYLDKLVKEAQALVTVVTDATKETADKAKNKIDMKKLEFDLDKSYAALGRIMYQIEKGALCRDDSIVAAACKRVEEQENALAELKAKEAKTAKETPEEAPAEEQAAAPAVAVVLPAAGKRITGRG